MKHASGYQTMKMKCTLFSLFIMLLAGCVPSTNSKKVDIPDSEKVIKAQTEIIEADPSLQAVSVLPAKWWELFNDQTLKDLETQAVGSNLDLRASVVRIQESQAQLGVANSALLPSVSAESGYVRSRISEHSPMYMLGAPAESSSTWTLGIRTGWELDLWGHLRHLSDSARAQLEASTFGMQSVKVSVQGDVARTYLLIRGLQSQIVIVEENRKIADNLVQLTESRERNGIATRYDTSAARADIASIQARITQLEQQRDILMNSLAMLLGKPPRELNTSLAYVQFPTMPKKIPVGLPSSLAKSRPDILQAEARLRSAVADIGAAKADFYPRISLNGNLGIQAFELSDLGSWGSRQFSIGPSLYLPIFQGGRFERNLELSESRHQQAGIAYQQTVLNAWREVDDALNAYATEQKRHTQLQIAVDQNKTALDVAQRGYQQGTVDFSAVLIARRTLLTSQSELTDCTTNTALSIVSLYRALGGGWSAELMQENSIGLGGV